MCSSDLGPPDLAEVCLALAAEMLALGGAAPTPAAARPAAETALADGRALDRFRRLVEAQGGDPAVADDPGLLPQAPVRRVLEAETGGSVAQIDARAVGEAAVALGAGRTAVGGTIDPAVGFHISVKPGDPVEPGQPLATVFARRPDDAEAACAALRAAIAVAAEPGPAPLPLVVHRITRAGVEAWTAGDRPAS